MQQNQTSKATGYWATGNAVSDGEPFPEVVDECHIPECPLFNIVASQNILSKVFQVTPSDIFLHGCIFVNMYALEREQNL